MSLDPLSIIGLSVLIVIGNYSLFQSKFEKDFVHKYEKFKKRFENWKNNWIRNFYAELKRKTRESDKNPEDLIQFVNKWSSQKAIIDRISNEYNNLVFWFKSMVAWLVLAIIFSFGAIIYPNPILELSLQETHPLLGNLIIIRLIDISTFCLGVGVLIVFIYVWNMHSLSLRLAKSETGEPMEKIIEVKEE